MFSVARWMVVSVLAGFLVLLAGCKYEPEPFVSELGLETSCVPGVEYYAAVVESTESKVESYAVRNDSRPGPIKFKELSEFIRLAREDISNCHSHNVKESGFSESESLSYREFHMRLGSAWAITAAAEVFEESWEDSDIEILLRALEGQEIDSAEYIDFSRFGQCEKDET